MSQATAASYMGTTSASGTSASQLLRGLQHYVGYPVVVASYYLWVAVSGLPTQAENTSFRSNVKYDIDFGTTLTGDAYEVGGCYPNGQPYPHPVRPSHHTIKRWPRWSRPEMISNCHRPIWELYLTIGVRQLHLEMGTLPWPTVPLTK